MSTALLRAVNLVLDRASNWIPRCRGVTSILTLLGWKPFGKLELFSSSIQRDCLRRYDEASNWCYRWYLFAQFPNASAVPVVISARVKRALALARSAELPRVGSLERRLSIRVPERRSAGLLDWGRATLVGDQLQGQENRQADQQRQIDANQAEIQRQRKDMETLRRQGEY
jgi:hypothetical protein